MKSIKLVCVQCLYYAVCTLLLITMVGAHSINHWPTKKSSMHIAMHCNAIDVDRAVKKQYCY